MKVFKFGGASVKNADGVRNLSNIIAMESGDLVIVVSAMGKTTNALEQVVEALYQGNTELASQRAEAIFRSHAEVITDLGLNPQSIDLALPFPAATTDYDFLYDQIVSYGELWSTRIVAAYLCSQGVQANWVDMTATLITDSCYREANIQMEPSRQRLMQAVAGHRITVVQGFIGGTDSGHHTTLGREGSDYSAAVVANLLDAESVTIWKDVPGILNADPRIVSPTVKIDELTYADAVELAYSGAQVIHPKTLRPLENKQIPLFVKPFTDPSAAGTIIHSQTAHPIDVPVYIWRDNQLLITMRAKDLGFLLEESLSDIFQVLHRYRLKVSLIQSSAVTISVSVDHTRYTGDAIAELSQRYRVSWNDHLALLTIRGTTPEIIDKETRGKQILLSQTTRRTARFLMKK